MNWMNIIDVRKGQQSSNKEDTWNRRKKKTNSVSKAVNGRYHKCAVGFHLLLNAQKLHLF